MMAANLEAPAATEAFLVSAEADTRAATPAR
jgi:hypothetical protein